MGTVDIRDAQIERLKKLLVQAVAELPTHTARKDSICSGCKLIYAIMEEIKGETGATV